MVDSSQPCGLYSPWNSPGLNTGVGNLSLLQGIFPTQGSNPGFLHYRQILYQLSHKGSPRILEWVTYPFSSRLSQPRNWTGASCIARGFFTNWAIKEAYQEMVYEYELGGSVGKESACNAGDPGLIPRLVRSPGGGHGNPLQDSCLGESHGQTSLEGYSRWGCLQELDMTESLNHELGKLRDSQA